MNIIRQMFEVTCADIGGGSQVENSFRESRNMPRETSGARAGQTAPKKKAATTKTKGRASKSAAKEKTTRQAGKSGTAAAGKTTARRPAGSTTAKLSDEQILNRVETDIATAIDTLNNQMNAALAGLTEVAAAHSHPRKAVVRTAPIDRATAMFQRLVAEVVDDQLAEMLPPLVALRNELTQYSTAQGGHDRPDSDFCQRASETLDHVLALANVRSYQARIGDPLDPLIHLAVGETERHDLDNGAVVEEIAPGFRSAHGKVIVPAKVLVNRR